MNIFITGGTSGIGKELALAYQQQGHNVAVCGRKKSPIQNEFKYFYIADVSDREQIKNAIADFHSKTGKLDIVIANAGIAIPDKKPIPDFELAKRIVDINIQGLLNTFDISLEIMLKQKEGHLVAISSVSAYNGLPGTSTYCASKAFVKILSESYAIDLKKFGIAVTCICPGFIDTPLTQKNNHKMPFLQNPKKAAQKIIRAIEKRKILYSFPTPMLVCVRVMQFLPRYIYVLLMGPILNKLKSLSRH